MKSDIGDPLLNWMTRNAPHVKQIDPLRSGAAIIEVAEALTLGKTGEFWNWDGTHVPW